MKEIRDLVINDYQKVSQKNKEKVTVSSSSSSSTSTSKSKFKSPKEHHASKRMAKSTSERKKERISRIQDNEDEEDDAGQNGRESRKTDEARRSEKAREEARAPQRRGSPGAYKMKYLTDSARTPFSHEVASAPYPRHFDLADLPKYDGTQDPCHHLEAFDKLMWVRTISGPVTQRLFAATLTGPAQRWLS